MSDPEKQKKRKEAEKEKRKLAESYHESQDKKKGTTIQYDKKRPQGGWKD